MCKVNPRQGKINDSKVSFVAMANTSSTGELLSQRKVEYDEVKKGYTPFERGDILVAKITPCFENGKGAYTDTLATEFGFGSTEFHVLRCNEENYGKFVHYHTQSSTFRKRLEREMVGSAGQKRIQAGSIESYAIRVPEFEEQKAITDVLSADDREIDLLHQSIDAEKQKKKALMQLLLTGIVRVNI